MGVIGRLAKWGLRLAVVVLALTVGAVMYLSDANLRLYGQGRALAAPVDAILVLGGGVDGAGEIHHRAGCQHQHEHTQPEPPFHQPADHSHSMVPGGFEVTS